MSCRLIINVDDLGGSPGVNAAVAQLYDAGIVTSASLMVAGEAVPDALGLLESRPGLAVGLHVVAVCGRAILPAAEVSSLVDQQGRFADSPALAGLRYTLLPRCRRELRREVEAQFAAFAQLGLPWSHVDTHLHFGLAPVLFQAMRAAAGGYPICGWRIPEDDLSLYRKIDPADAARQAGLAHVFTALCGRQRKVLREAGLVLTQACYGTFRTGQLDEAYLVRLVELMPDGCFELHCHPDLDSEPGRREFDALASPGFRRALASRNAELVSYPSLGDVRTPVTVR